MNDTSKTQGQTAVRSLVTSHVLDTTRGLPAIGVPVTLSKFNDDAWTVMEESTTDSNGRCADLACTKNFEAGRYKLQFGVGKYFTDINVDTMFPVIEIIFQVKDSSQHHHVPLLLSPYGYTTYRGS